MRFDSARVAGLTEQKIVEKLDPNSTSVNLSARETAALTLTDSIIGNPRSLTAAQKDQLKTQFNTEELVELTLGVGLFLGMSKVLINLGLEPDSMPVTILPTPANQNK